MDGPVKALIREGRGAAMTRGLPDDLFTTARGRSRLGQSARVTRDHARPFESGSGFSLQPVYTDRRDSSESDTRRGKFAVS